MTSGSGARSRSGSRRAHIPSASLRDSRSSSDPMQLSTLDWLVITVYAVVAVGTGLFFARRAGNETEDFFLAGRSMPWWLLGTSMVATTFSTLTPNLVTDLVRTGGVSQNWLWWAFVLTGMATVF